MPGADPCTAHAETRKKYFSVIKFSTQVLKSMWKSTSHNRVTSCASMLLTSLHRFCAIKILE
jgi:hypothetical protein